MVSKVQLSKTALRIYWKEYFPFSPTSEKSRFSERIIKYSLSTWLFRMVIFFTDQPNSCETMSQFSINTSLHSLSALIPCSLVSEISIESEYHRAALQSPVSSEALIFRP